MNNDGHDDSYKKDGSHERFYDVVEKMLISKLRGSLDKESSISLELRGRTS